MNSLDSFVNHDKRSANENKKKNSFNDKTNLEASCLLIKTRSNSYKPTRRSKQIDSEWDKEPIDFTWKLYHPNPPKRNSRDAIKPWLYDNYLKGDKRIFYDSEQYSSVEGLEEKKNKILNNLFKSKQDAAESDEFKIRFKMTTPNAARLEAAKTMGFREGLDSYTDPKPHDFRGVSLIYNQGKKIHHLVAFLIFFF